MLVTTTTTLIPTINDPAPVDQPLTQAEKNAQADYFLIWMIVPITATILSVGAYFWIRKRIKKYRARRANNADNDIELQQRAIPERPNPEPASPEHAPGLFYLNQDHASGIIETPSPTHSASSIKDYAKGVMGPGKA
ncbi:hypothetical protein LA080_016080 [Diaporthe eres]|nr:hypothetical protein LA080_016080 [Diaporthe eres]